MNLGVVSLFSARSIAAIKGSTFAVLCGGCCQFNLGGRFVPSEIVQNVGGGAARGREAAQSPSSACHATVQSGLRAPTLAWPRESSLPPTGGS